MGRWVRVVICEDRKEAARECGRFGEGVSRGICMSGTGRGFRRSESGRRALEADGAVCPVRGVMGAVVWLSWCESMQRRFKLVQVTFEFVCLEVYVTGRD